jgi:hypothetical protein
LFGVNSDVPPPPNSNANPHSWFTINVFFNLTFFFNQIF